jgi:hypothetical protein
VNSEIDADQQELRESLALGEKQLAELIGERRTIDTEIESLSGQREQHELLDSICSSLDRLAEMDAAKLFWGDQLDAGEWQEHLAGVRESSAGFCATIEKVEERRGEVDVRIGEQEDVLDILDYHLAELDEEEELRKNEWALEREEPEEKNRRIVMPWTRGCEEDQLFNQSLFRSVAASLLLALLLSLIELPIPDRAELMKVPDRVAKVIELPKPEPVEPVAEPEPEEPQMAEEQPVEETPDVTEPVQVAEAEAQKAEVKSKGILAFSDSFADRARTSPSARLGAQARIGNAGEAAVGRPSRAMVTSNASGSSGGINLASISRDVGGGAGGGQLGDVEVSQVASSIGGDGSGDRPRAGGRLAGRTDEEIQIVFDRYKASLYRLYNRELRRDPTLRGQLVLKLTIEPDGTVSMCAVQGASMKAPQLADQVLTRVRGFDFGAKENISAMTIIYPIDFLPAAS